VDRKGTRHHILKEVGKMKKRWFAALSLLLTAGLLLAACAPAATPEPTTAPVEQAAPTEAPPAEPTVDPMQALITAAKAEGEIVSYGLPDDWANYGGMWKIFEDKYGITHLDTDMGSGEIIAALQTEKTVGVADITDLGINFGGQIVSDGLSQPYKNSHWDEIPDWAKDPNGYWAAAYWGAIGFCVNPDKVTNIPTSWADLLKPEYKGMISMKDPRESGTANYVVLASAVGNGGSETNVQPGLDYFKQMYELGQMSATSPSTSNIQKGEVPIALFWDFDCLSKAKDTGMPLKLVIPSEGTVAGVYVQFATVAAPHPNAAKLMLETMFSDEGQLNYAMGFTHPIRNVEIPADLKAQFPPDEAYASVYFPKDFTKLTDAATAIAEGWESVAQ
jgi:putative spermidine/putrescine transport system substrate-binding protein